MSYEEDVEIRIGLRKEIRVLKDEKNCLMREISAREAELSRLRAANAELVELIEQMAPLCIDAELDVVARRTIRRITQQAEQAKPEVETCVWEDRGMEGWWPSCCDEGDGGCSKWEYPEAPKTCPGCGKRIEVRQ